MDPLTQGVVAAVAAQQPVKREHLFVATCLGLFSGMAPDLDVLIRSDTDPLFAIEYHRHFTHSLLFIPFGSLMCAIFFYYLFAKKQAFSFKKTYIYCTLGYATHGLLDACTTYGTQLLWPFSDMRVAWNTISIIDPIFTLPLLVMVGIAAFKKSRIVARAALIWVCLYSIFGIVQRERAEMAGLRLAESRGHTPVTLEAKPSFANLIVWKVVYSTSEHYYVDAVRVGISSQTIEGEKIDQLDIEQAFPWLDIHSQQAKDIERFRWFSNGYLALSPHYPDRIIDIRYSLLPNEIRGLWGIELNQHAAASDHVSYDVSRQRNPDTLKRLWAMIIGQL